MSKIKKIELSNFRIHEKLEIDFNKDIVIFIGENASGKTSILEAIYYVSSIKSNRTNKDIDLIYNKKEFAKIKLITLDKQYQIIINELGKKTFINGIEKRKLSDFIGDLLVVYYSVEDISLIKGSPNERRRFLNIELSKLDKIYLKNLSKYNEILKQRNELLKKLDINSDLVFLNILNEQISEVASNIVIKRKEFLDMLNIYINKTYKKIFNMSDEIKIIYKPSIDHTSYLKDLNEKNIQDIITKTTNYGIHRDDFIIYKNNQEVIKFSSQGEQKSIIIALKFCLVEYIINETKKEPVLLLDDLFSELDDKRQNNIINSLKNIQTFITTTDLKNIKENLLENAQILKLRK